jgi:hypothetical protein
VAAALITAAATTDMVLQVSFQNFLHGFSERFCDTTEIFTLTEI